MARLPSSRISPTAHYTGYVWLRNGLSHPAFETNTGKFFFNAMRPVNRISALVGGATLEEMLLARHRVIDATLEEAIERGEISQVLEVAAGLSPRGYRFARRFPHLTYIEADLPEMAAHKRAVLESVGSLESRHPVVEIDALSDEGEHSIAAVCARLLDPDHGAAIITEGLLSYFETDSIRAIWARFATALAAHPSGIYLSDLHLDSDMDQVRGARLFRLALNRWTRGQNHTYFKDVDEATRELLDAGFDSAEIPYASDCAGDYNDALELAPVDRTGRVRIVIARRSAEA